MRHALTASDVCFAEPIPEVGVTKGHAQYKGVHWVSMQYNHLVVCLLKPAH